MRRLAIQNPDALIREIEKLRESVENRDIAFRMTMEAHQILRARLDAAKECLQVFKNQTNHSCNIEYGNTVGMENCLTCKAVAALEVVK